MASPVAHPNTFSRRPLAAARPARPTLGFTVVELLVVIAIIIALLGTLLAALALASRRAQAAQTQVFLTSISNALVAFERDIGYVPPLLGSASPTMDNPRDYFTQPTWALSGSQPTPASVTSFQRWYSYTSLPEYLLGYGDRTQDGHGVFNISAAPAGSPGSREQALGIRHPGDDGFWDGVLNPRPNQAPGRLLARNIVDVGSSSYTPANANGAILSGKVFGPYLQLTDSTNLAAIKSFNATTGEPNLVFPGDDPDFETLPKVFVDYWGSPIEYYRTPYVLPDLKARETWASDVLGRDLGDIFALRPAEFKPGEDRSGVADASGDDGTLARLKTANYALLSRGADKTVDRTTRRDASGFNRDNIVEVGQ
jgi:type II secretory pathway pseudopilin PulG